MGVKFIKIAVIYFVIGVSLGMYMSMSHNHLLTPVHAHINLLGWVSSGLVGIIYVRFPKAATTTLAKLHFWLFNTGLPFMMIGLALLLLTGVGTWETVVAIGGTLVFISVLLYAINVLLNFRVSDLK